MYSLSSLLCWLCSRPLARRILPPELLPRYYAIRSPVLAACSCSCWAFRSILKSLDGLFCL